MEILTAPNNGQGQFTAATATTTAADGAWSAAIGPVLTLVEAVYGGSAALLPATSTPVELNVPARISLSVSAHVVPWDRIVTLRGHLDGGYVPPDGVALRLLIDLPDRTRPYEPLAFRTDAEGNFVIHWSWGTGSGVVTYPLAVATTATESDFRSRHREVRGSASPSDVQRLTIIATTTGSAGGIRGRRTPVLASVTAPSTIGSDEHSDPG